VVRNIPNQVLQRSRRQNKEYLKKDNSKKKKNEKDEEGTVTDENKPKTTEVKNKEPMMIFNQQVDYTTTNNLPQKPLLMYDDMVDLNATLKQAASDAGIKTEDQYIHHMYQRHGDVVHVTVGWAHQVVNLQACAKLAFDYAKAHDAMKCVHTNNILHTMFPNVNPSDYRGLQREAVIASRHM
jgi:hypothetical protein